MNRDGETKDKLRNKDKKILWKKEKKGRKKER